MAIRKYTGHNGEVVDITPRPPHHPSTHSDSPSNLPTNAPSLSASLTTAYMRAKLGVTAFLGVIVVLFIASVVFNLHLHLSIGKSDKTFVIDLSVKDRNIQTNVKSAPIPIDSIAK